MYYRLRSTAATAYHLNINKYSIRTNIKKQKEIHEAVAAAMPAGTKTLNIMGNIFVSPIENTFFMEVQDCYKKGIPIDSKMIWLKTKSLYKKNLKQKEGEGSKDQWNKIERPEINPRTMDTLSLKKEWRIYNGLKTISSTSGAGKSGQPFVKEWN